MQPNVSSLADISSVFYRGRAKSSSLADNTLMENDNWRGRLAAAIKEKNTSLRKVSLASGKGAGYLHSILVEGKDPSIDNLAEVCRIVGVTLPYVLYGYSISPEAERLLRLFEARPEMREGILKLLESQSLTPR